jgi:Ca-activated chloride channel family protein
MTGALAAWLGIDGFERPALLAAVLLATLVATFVAVRREAPALPWSAWPEVIAAGARRRDLGRSAALAGRALALVLLAVALAGPLREHSAPPPPGEGLDLVLVLDTSESMQALDAEVAGTWRTRLELARAVVARFASQRIAEGDRVGLVVFGETAFTLCPLSSDGRLLGAALDRVTPGMAGSATAVGDALALAVKRAEPQPESATTIAPVAGRLVVLLTDGRSNAGAIPADVAAALARARGVRVHTVGIGGAGEVAMERAEAAGGRGLRFERHDIDRETLAAIAATTGGLFFAAQSSADLDSVYTAIDAQERVPRRSPPREHHTTHPEPFLAGAALLMAIEAAAARGIARRIP